MTRSDWIAVGALAISFSTWYFGPRRYDDATIFINNPEIIENNSVIEGKLSILSDIKEYEGEVVFSIGVVNNGLKPFILNRIGVHPHRFFELLGSENPQLISETNEYLEEKPK
jgi:hypothetical protein